MLQSVLLGGLLASYLLQQDEPTPITAGHGALAGLLAGVAGAFVWLIVALALEVLMAPLQERMLEEVLQSARDMPPEVREWFELLASNDSPPLRLAAGFTFQLLGGALFATLGGVLAATFFRKPAPPVLPPLQPES